MAQKSYPAIVVSVFCLSYNHNQYIRESLDSFIAQKTSFAYEVLIHDDASTDGTEEIIREYEERHPRIIKPLYEKENQWKMGRQGSLVFNLPRAKGKYIAFCDGDDKWLDTNKLQKQVDFLEANPTYGLVHTDAAKYDENSGDSLNSINSRKGIVPPSGWVFEKLLLNNFICTLTVMVRTEVLKQVKDNLSRFNPPVLNRDITIWLELARLAQIHYLPDVTAVYRKREGSVSRSINPEKNLGFSRGGIDILMRFQDEYNVKKDLRDRSIFAYIDRHMSVIACNRAAFLDIDEYIRRYKPSSIINLILKYMYMLKLNPQLAFNLRKRFIKITAI